MNPSFVHLRLHSEFSLIDGLVRLKPLVKQVADLGMPAVALTDHCNFYGQIKFYKAAVAAGVKPIYGSDFFLKDDDDETQVSKLCLLAQNDKGYRNLTELISMAYQQGQYLGVAYVKRSWVAEKAEGLIALSGGKAGEIGRALLSGKQALAAERLQSWMTLFPDRFYLELQRTGRENDENYLHQAVALANQYQCPVVATNEVCFIKASEFEAHEARVCINEGRTLDDPRRVKKYSEQQYLRSPAEMQELFSDIPEALQNTVEIAKRCNVEIKLGTYYLPEYPIPDDLEADPYFQKVSYQLLEQQTVKSLAKNWAGKEDSPEYKKELRTGIFFRKISREGLDERLAFLKEHRKASLPPLVDQEYLDRLDFELDIILEMGFPGYFLIVMDFIQWSKDQDIPVGPGRGSGAGSLVAYVQKITDLDPLEYDLLFERFLNPERVSMPDFDVDFCMDNRDKVISYVADNYGRDAVSQIVTFGTMAAKAVVRDVARVQGKSYGLADKLSKMIPFEIGMTLSKAIEQEPSLKSFITDDEQAAEIWAMATQLEGVTRNVGKHAGGVVIAPSKLTDFAPLYCDETGGGLVTQFDKNDVEEAGLVKFDFLGLRTLTIIDWAVKMINRPKPDGSVAALAIDRINLEDAETFKLLKRGETTAVFQLESRGMKELIKKLKPDNLEDMIALVALFRPGPLDSGMVEDFVNRKHGVAEVAYPDVQYQHEWLKPVLEPTYGVIVYQEQVMQIAQVLAGYSLGGADMLRRAMGKKKPEEMAKQRSIFKEGAIKQGVDSDLAMKIFDLVEKFAGYGFNKSHSAAYALVSYQTAWLKTHYPAEFMAATMSSELQNTDKIVIFIEECREMKLPLKLPDVNEGEYMFTVNEQGEIIYGLGAIKGLGEGPIDSIIAARQEGGPFKNLFDFCGRVDPRKVNKRALDALIRSGSFDGLGVERAVLIASTQEAVKAAEQSASNKNAGMMDLFGEVVPNGEGDNVYAGFEDMRPLTPKERLKGEKDTLGLYVTGHPIDEYEKELKKIVRNRIVDLKPDRSTQLIAGLVVDMRTMKTKRGDTMAFVQLDDRTARIEIGLFSDAYEQARDLLGKDTVILVEGEVEYDEYRKQTKVRGKSVRSLLQVREELVQSLTLSLNSEDFNSSHRRGFSQEFSDILTPALGGTCPVRIAYQQAQAQGELSLGPSWQVSPSDELIQCLKDRFGNEKVELKY
ncbi:DNA polymerase III subunit alpha [Dasania marina]|uniref:DNA polymerase III subunit alpha n=1 Tax=Dasania marina TaxID=471499 RepID=UPI00037A950F|nr:DNA polymerase III subunit alpha [Dasania marina]